MAQTKCPNCRKLEAQLKQLQNRIEELEKELRRGRRQTVPFSKGKARANSWLSNSPLSLDAKQVLKLATSTP